MNNLEKLLESTKEKEQRDSSLDYLNESVIVMYGSEINEYGSLLEAADGNTEKKKNLLKRMIDTIIKWIKSVIRKLAEKLGLFDKIRKENSKLKGKIDDLKNVEKEKKNLEKKLKESKEKIKKVKTNKDGYKEEVSILDQEIRKLEEKLKSIENRKLVFRVRLICLRTTLDTIPENRTVSIEILSKCLKETEKIGDIYFNAKDQVIKDDKPLYEGKFPDNYIITTLKCVINQNQTSDIKTIIDKYDIANKRFKGIASNLGKELDDTQREVSYISKEINTIEDPKELEIEQKYLNFFQRKNNILLKMITFISNYIGSGASPSITVFQYNEEDDDN